MKQTRPTLEEPYYTDGIGRRRCHFCLSQIEDGHRFDCPTMETVHDVASGEANVDAVNPQHPLKGRFAMRLFDSDKVPCYLDAVNFRAEKTPDGEMTVADLTLRVQPLTVELATALDPELRAELFTLTDGEPKRKVTLLGWKLTVPKQHMDCFLLPEQMTTGGDFTLLDAEITEPRVRTERGVDGFALIFYATVGPLGREELEFLVLRWLRQQRFVTFRESQAVMDFAGKSEADVEAEPPRKKARKVGDPAIDAGDELRPGVLAEH